MALNDFRGPNSPVKRAEQEKNVEIILEEIERKIMLLPKNDKVKKEEIMEICDLIERAGKLNKAPHQVLRLQTVRRGFIAANISHMYRLIEKFADELQDFSAPNETQGEIIGIREALEKVDPQINKNRDFIRAVRLYQKTVTAMIAAKAGIKISELTKRLRRRRR